MRKTVALTLAVTALLLMSGCSSAEPGSSAEPSGSPLASPSRSAGASGPASASPGTATPAPATSAPVASPTAVPAGGCGASSLGLTTGGTEGAAGSTVVTLVFTNTSATSCTLQGWPGVSLVGSGDGTQLGAAADQDLTSPHETVKLTSGGTATVAVKIAQALNYSNAECEPRDADGLRVYAPGDTGALFVPLTDVVACSNSSIHLLTNGAVQPA